MRERSPSTRTRKDKTGRLYRSLVKTAVRKRGGEKRGRSWTPSFDEMIKMNHPPPGVVSIAFLSAPILISSFRLSPSILIEIYWNLESIPRPFHGGNATMSTSPWGAIAGRNALCACLYAGHSIWTLPPIIKTFTLRSRIRQWMFISNVKWNLHSRKRQCFELINIWAEFNIGRKKVWILFNRYSIFESSVN